MHPKCCIITAQLCCSPNGKTRAAKFPRATRRMCILATGFAGATSTDRFIESRCGRREIIQRESPTARLAGFYLRQGCVPPSGASSAALPWVRHEGRLYLKPHHQDSHKTEPVMVTCSNGFRARSSPLQQCTVPASRSWLVGAQALTGQGGQPSRGSSATTCWLALLERVKDGR